MTMHAPALATNHADTDDAAGRGARVRTPSATGSRSARRSYTSRMTACAVLAAAALSIGFGAVMEDQTGAGPTSVAAPEHCNGTKCYTVDDGCLAESGTDWTAISNSLCANDYSRGDLRNGLKNSWRFQGGKLRAKSRIGAQR
jgi:hypothetical protein